jgi:GTP-binding protein
VDLPGYGWAKVSKYERKRFVQLVRGYVEKREALIGIVWLLDIRRTPSDEDLEMSDVFNRSRVPVLVAVTKADKTSRGQRARRLADIVKTLGLEDDQTVVTSAQTKEGIEDLRLSIEQLVGSGT